MWYIALLTASCLALSYAGQPLPPYIKPCARSDPNINECAVKHGNEAIPHLVKGDRKYKVQVLDPFDVKEVKILNDGERPSGISIALRNAKVYGLKDTVVKEAIINLDAKHNYFETLTPKVQIIGQYEASGRILLLPLTGKGNVTLTVENMYVLFDEYWQLVPRNGEIYFIRDNVTVNSRTPTGFHIHITNLFNGNKLLGDQMNEFLNENWKDAYNELSPTIFKVISEILLSVIARISDAVPYDNLFPEKLP